MGKKKNKTPVFVLKPWCWYCEREFEDEKVLLQHQKSKHFKCQLCPRKLNTAGGLMVHSQQVHKCEPEPLTNTLPGRDGYDIEIFGMEGVPTNALAEWKARKESEAGTAALAAAAAAKRPRQAYTIIPEADLQAALAQHKALMAKREQTRPRFEPPTPSYPVGPPTGFPPHMPPPNVMPNFMPSFPPNGAMPPSPPGLLSNPDEARSPLPPTGPSPIVSSPAAATDVHPVPVLPPKDGVLWPDADSTPAEKRALQPRYRYTSPSPDDQIGSRKRKAAAEFL